MSYKDINIKTSYETSINDTQLLDEFYIPMLEQTSNYFRIAGFFNSTSLTIASKGIEGLIKNNGKMRLLISPEISEQDYYTIKHVQNLDGYDLELLNQIDISEFSNLDHLQALAWMLANNKLEIKIVIDKKSTNSIFHQKIGLGTDMEGNMLSFSGSINETASAWLSNIEEFKTFKSWESGQLEYLIDDLKKFNAYWNDEKPDIAKVFELPDSLKQEIIKIAPKDVNELSLMRHYKNKNLKNSCSISLFSHQQKAIDKWLNNDCKLLMEMATGTGKTRTAIGCFLTQLNKINNYLVIVATPQNTLSKQWKNDIEEELKISFEKSKIIDGSIRNWKQELETTLIDLNINYYKNSIVYTTHDTLSNPKFINTIKSYKNQTKILLICDEVHGIGSENQRKALLDEYDYRIGLSATPTRMFDDIGTSIIREYFGNNSFVFDIHDALGNINPLTGHPFLNPYYYYPIFINLTDAEELRYLSYTKQIIILQNQENIDHDELNLKKIVRAKILKDAELKYKEIENLILRLNNTAKIKDTIIFATENQAEEVLSMLSSHGITRCKITEQESTNKKLGVNGLSEREEYINQFRKGNIQVLVGLKCLDEGIDIKNARIAILMASSTNPREYIQRIGRVIRPEKNKPYSEIYDFIVAPSNKTKIDSSIIEKEAKRAFYVAENAINRDDIFKLFSDQGVKRDIYD